MEAINLCQTWTIGNLLLRCILCEGFRASLSTIQKILIWQATAIESRCTPSHQPPTHVPSSSSGSAANKDTLWSSVLTTVVQQSGSSQTIFSRSSSVLMICPKLMSEPPSSQWSCMQQENRPRVKGGVYVDMGWFRLYTTVGVCGWGWFSP